MGTNKKTHTQDYAESELQILFQEFMDEREAKIEKAGSQEYVEWLYEYAHEKPVSDDEYFEEEDVNGVNASLLSYFYGYVKKMSICQRVMEVYLKGEEFPTNEFIIRIKDRYFRIQLIIGQGVVTWVEECEKPDFCYVMIPGKEELHENRCDWTPAE